MKIIILAAGQGTRLRPLTDNQPKCMVEVKGKSLIERQLLTMYSCGIEEEDIIIVGGYKSDVLRKKLENTKIHFVINENFPSTNMVYSLMCARGIMEGEKDIIISYGDILYSKEVFEKLLASEEDMSVIVDDGWYEYWSKRCENPLDDAETLMFDKMDYLTEIGQKTEDRNKVQSQYIGLMRFRGQGLKVMLDLSEEAKKRSQEGQKLWKTERKYEKMYMTDLLQGLIEEGHKLKAVHIQRGWYEIDDCDDLKIVEAKLDE